MIFGQNETVVFFGDSITDHGRDRSNPDSLGDGYVSKVVERLRHQRAGSHFVNAGIGGDTTRHLLARLETDVLRHRPQWVSIAIGVNDVWRSFGVGDARDAVGLEEFEANYAALIQRLRAADARLLLVEPFVIEPDRAEPFRAQVDRYARVVSRLAEAHGIVFVPFQQAFDRQGYLPASAWSEDRVHPNPAAVELLATEFLRVVSGWEPA